MSADGARVSRLARATSEPGDSASGDAALARAHPLTSFGLDALVAGAARPRPWAPAIRDGETALAFGEVVAAAGAGLARLRELDLARGERVLLLAAPRAQTLVALTALVAAGLEPVLAPVHAPAERLAAAARAVRAAAILAPARFGALDLEETLLAVAARSPSIRVLATLGGVLDGAVDFSIRALLAPGAPRAPLHDGWPQDERVAIGALDDAGAPVFASQGALLARALDLVRATRAGGAAPALCLVSPASLAGLVAGPLAALLAGVPLHFFSPFEAAAFLKALDATGPARLVAPAAALPEFAQAGLLRRRAFVSATAIGECAEVFDRWRSIATARSHCDCPVVSLDADGAIRAPSAERTGLGAGAARTA